MAEDLVEFIDELSNEEKTHGNLDSQEKISSVDAFRSLHQLVADLKEAIVRCTSRQAFLSTSLFLLWAADEINRLVTKPNANPNENLVSITKQLLANYISTYVLIEKQKAFEKKQSLESQGSIPTLHNARFFQKHNTKKPLEYRIPRKNP